MINNRAQLILFLKDHCEKMYRVRSFVVELSFIQNGAVTYYYAAVWRYIHLFLYI